MLALLLACVKTDPSPEFGVTDVVVEIDAVIPTLVRVRWTTEMPARTRVRWTSDGHAGATPLTAESGTAHEAAFLGVPAGETATLSLEHLADDGATGQVDAGVVTLDAAPDDVPTVDVTLADGETPPTPYLAIDSEDPATGHSWFQVVDWHGHPVWWRGDTAAITPFSSITNDLTGLYVVAVDNGEQVVFHSAWDGTLTPIGGAGAHHEVHPLPDGKVGVCRNVTRQVGDEAVAADILSIVDPTTGESRDVWDALPLYHTGVSTRCEGVRLVDGALDGTHCNGLSYDAERARWYVSLYCQGSIVAVDEATGTTEWVLGGAGATVAAGDGADFAFAHAPRVADDRLYLFDNGRDEDGSRILALSVADGAEESTFEAAWRGLEEEYSPLLGSVQLLDDGLIGGFGASRAAYWYAPEGDIRATITLGGYHILGSVEAIGEPAL